MSPLLKYPIQQLLHQKPDIQLQHQSINQMDARMQNMIMSHSYHISPVLQDYKRDLVN
ncbi:hypothetical protein Hanom_Chr09g00811131 [Helianthus anomalus]